MRRIVFDHFDICHQPDSCVGALNQIMTKQRILWEPVFQDPMHSVDFVDSFSRKNTLAVEVLIYVRNGACIDVEARLPGINISHSRSGCALHAYPYARLEYSVTGNDDVLFGINDCLVQRMGKRPCEAMG